MYTKQKALNPKINIPKRAGIVKFRSTVINGYEKPMDEAIMRTSRHFVVIRIYE